MFCVAIYLACKQAAKSFPHNDGEGNRNYIVAGPCSSTKQSWLLNESRCLGGGRRGGQVVIALEDEGCQIVMQILTFCNSFGGKAITASTKTGGG